MPTPIREAALAAIAARLAAAIPGVAVERARRSEPAPGEFPRLILFGRGAIPDETQDPGSCFWTLEFSVAGYVAAASDLALDQALSDLHASMVAALHGWSAAGLIVEITPGAAQFEAFDALESSAPAGLFAAEFSALAVTPTASPYAP